MFNGSLGVLKCILRHYFGYVQYLLDTYKQFKRIKVFHMLLVILPAEGQNTFHRREIIEMQVTLGNRDMELGDILVSLFTNGLQTFSLVRSVWIK